MDFGYLAKWNRSGPSKMIAAQVFFPRTIMIAIPVKCCRCTRFYVYRGRRVPLSCFEMVPQWTMSSRVILIFHPRLLLSSH